MKAMTAQTAFNITMNFSLTAQAAITAYRFAIIGARTALNGNGYASADQPHNDERNYENEKADYLTIFEGN